MGCHEGEPVAGVGPYSLYIRGQLPYRTDCAREAALSRSKDRSHHGGFENEDGHVCVYPPTGLREEEIADIEEKLADRCVDILVEKGVFICSAVYD